MRSLGLGVSPVFRRTGGVENPLGIFGADLTMWLEPRLDADTSTAPPDIDSMADQGTGGHNASQSTAANKPHLVSAGIADFDGSNDYLTLAAGGGWPAHTSHSFFALTNRRTHTSLRQYLCDFATGRLALVCGTDGSDGEFGWIDSAARIASGDTVTGWQILEWHFDADATAGTVLRTTATATSTLYSTAYNPRTLGGTAILCADIVAGRQYNNQLADIIVVSRATGHPTGVTTAAEREKARNYLRWVAKKIGVTL